MRDVGFVNRQVGNVGFMGVLITPPDANVVLAATLGGVYRSIDRWSSRRLSGVGLHSPFASWLATTPDGRTLYVGSADHGLYRGTPSASTGAPFSTASVAAWVERAGVR